MTLGEVVDELEVLDSDATIYAAKPWSKEARAVVAIEPDDGSIPGGAAGLDYFLEVGIAIEAARVSATGTRFERVVYYAERDAYLFDD
jgi:hypothetical protein